MHTFTKIINNTLTFIVIVIASTVDIGAWAGGVGFSFYASTIVDLGRLFFEHFLFLKKFAIVPGHVRRTGISRLAQLARAFD